MTAPNHALTGALIGFTVGNPWIAIPAAFLSHFVCDAIPHFDVPGATHEARIGSQAFLRIQLIGGFTLCVILVAVLGALHPAHWFLAATCAFFAASPDLLAVPRFLSIKRGGKDIRERWWFWRFHNNIQWFQRPIGAVVEVAWFIGACILLAPFLH